MSDGCFRVDHSKGVGHLQILHCAYREQAQGEPRFRRMDYCCEWGASLMSLSDRYRRACTDETEALSQAEQNERPESDDVPSTSKELEMTCLKDPQTLAENDQSLGDAPADTGIVLGRIFKHISNRLSKLETELAKKECLFSQCFPKKNDITSTHFLQSILLHPDGLLIEAVTDREMFWLELAPAGWARFDKVASHQDGKAADHSTDRGIFALRELQSTREPWPEGSTMTLAAFLWPRLVPDTLNHPAYQAMKSLVSQVEAS